MSYDTEITGYVEKKRIKKLKGVKAKELLLVKSMAMNRLSAKFSLRVLLALPRPSLFALLLQASNNSRKIIIGKGV